MQWYNTPLDWEIKDDQIRVTSLLRMAYLTEAKTLQVGLMGAAPEGEGFSVFFEGFSVLL